jgi:hypothetical protein
MANIFSKKEPKSEFSLISKKKKSLRKIKRTKNKDASPFQHIYLQNITGQNHGYVEFRPEKSLEKKRLLGQLTKCH